MILQAMAMEKPVIASPIGGIPEVLRHEGTGLVCTTGDPASFAHALLRLLADPSLGRRLGTSGRRVVHEKYSSSAMGERTEEFYACLAGRKKGKFPE